MAQEWITADEAAQIVGVTPHQIIEMSLISLDELREVSGRLLPVIIDTPLSRLDDVHRQTILGEFMTQVSQQVIVLATTVEVDEETLAFMQPALSRVYLLEADSTMTQISEQPVAASVAHVLLETID
jgi:DNA sulfur modification protein DndD